MKPLFIDSKLFHKISSDATHATRLAIFQSLRVTVQEQVFDFCHTCHQLSLTTTDDDAPLAPDTLPGFSPQLIREVDYDDVV